MVQLRLLGGALVETDTGIPTGSVSQRHPLALLTLLARTPGRTMSRSKLVGMLWPESPERVARNRLGTCVHNIRRALGDTTLISLADSLTLDTDVLGCDVDRFEYALEEGDQEAAVELYRGGFLDGFFLRGSPEFEHWADAERARLEHAYHQALESLAEREEARGTPEAAVKWWRRRASDAPYDTRVVSRLIVALAASGYAAEALRAADGHSLLVQQELGAEPGAEFRALVEEVRVAARGKPGEGARSSGLCVGRVPAAAPPSWKRDPMEGGRDRRPASARVMLLVGFAGLTGALIAGSYGGRVRLHTLTPSQYGAPTSPPEHAAAYELYLQAERLGETRPSSAAIPVQRIELYRRAVELAPTLASAWAGLADAENGRAWSSESPRAWQDSARAAAGRAVELDPRLAAAYKALGDSYWPAGGQQEEQIAAYTKALELDPSSWGAANNLAAILRLHGRLAEALAVLQRANPASPGASRFLGAMMLLGAQIGRDDLSDAWMARSHEMGAPIVHAEFAYELYYLGHAERARDILNRAASRSDDLATQRDRAALTLYSKDWTEGRRLYRELYPRRPGSNLPVYQGLLSDRTGLAWALAHLSRQEEAREIAADVLSHASAEVKNGSLSYLPRTRAAVALVILGDVGGAMDWLEEAVDVGFRDVRMMRTVPTLEPLHEEPRFKALAQRLDSMLVRERHLLEQGRRRAP